jgi:hypothetical protein
MGAEKLLNQVPLLRNHRTKNNGVELPTPKHFSDGRPVERGSWPFSNTPESGRGAKREFGEGVAVINEEKGGHDEGKAMGAKVFPS